MVFEDVADIVRGDNKMKMFKVTAETYVEAKNIHEAYRKIGKYCLSKGNESKQVNEYDNIFGKYGEILVMDVANSILLKKELDEED